MIATPSQVVASYLQSLGIVQRTSTNNPWWYVLGKRSAPPPDKAVFIYDPTGVKDGRLMDSGEVINHPGIQIVVRTNSYPDGLNKIREILSALSSAKRTAVTVGSETILLTFSVTSLPAHVGVEQDSTRDMFTMNGTVTLQTP